jgi:TDG/mug DNA glycosylase family protein
MGPGTGLAPLVGPNLRVLVCGFNPSIPAYRSGHYYANPSNRFYRLLHDAGLTPRLLSPAEDTLLPSMGIGVTDLCPVPSAMAHDLPASAFAMGVEALKVMLRRCRPRVLCCNGYGVYRALMGRPPLGAGLQDGILFEGVPVFAIPSSSGAACALSAVRLAAWRELAAYCARGTGQADWKSTLGVP